MKDATIHLLRLASLLLLLLLSGPTRAGFVTPITVSGGGTGAGTINPNNTLIANINETFTSATLAPVTLTLPVSPNTSGFQYQLVLSITNSTGTPWSSFNFDLIPGGNVSLAPFQSSSFPNFPTSVSQPTSTQVIVSGGTLANGGTFNGTLPFNSTSSGTIVINETPSGTGSGAGPSVPEPASWIPMGVGVLVALGYARCRRNAR
jgi:hypothetical protein